MNKKIEFANAQEMHKLYPDTFWAPSQEELDNVKVGDTVKVCAKVCAEQNRRTLERFWVKITKINGEILKGEVSNVLVDIDLKLDEEITFKKENIYDFIKKNNDDVAHEVFFGENIKRIRKIFKKNKND
jgi:hypothetical protein